MTKNKLTPEEKQMPAVHLPAKIPLMCVFNLFVTAFVNYILWTKDGIAAMIALLVIFVLPAMIGIFAYANCVVRFDKDTVVYRNFFRKIRRCPMHEIRSFAEGRFFASAVTDDISIPVNTRSQNGKWLAQLIEKKLNPDAPPPEELTELQYQKGYLYMLPFLMLGLIIFLHFAIAPSENPIEDIFGYTFFIAIFIAVTVYVITYIPRKIFYNDKLFVYIDARKREHRFYWEDLTEFRVDVFSAAFFYTFGTEQIKHDIPLKRSSLVKLLNKAESTLKENFLKRENTETDPSLSAEREFLKAKYSQKSGKIYRQNILNHGYANMMFIVLFAVIALMALITFSEALPADVPALIVIFLLGIAASIFEFLSLRYLEKMPYFLVFLTARGFLLSYEFLEHLPKEKRGEYLSLVFCKEDLEKYNIPAILDIPPAPTEATAVAPEETPPPKGSRKKKTLGKSALILAAVIVLLGAFFTYIYSLPPIDTKSYQTTLTHCEHYPPTFSDLYGTDGRIYNVYGFEQYCHDDAAFYRGIEEGKTFTIRGEDLDDYIFVESIRDEEGNVYYQSADQRAATKKIVLRYILIFTILALPFALFGFLMLRSYKKALPASNKTEDSKENRTKAVLKKLRTAGKVLFVLFIIYYIFFS